MISVRTSEQLWCGNLEGLCRLILNILILYIQGSRYSKSDCAGCGEFCVTQRAILYVYLCWRILLLTCRLGTIVVVFGIVAV